MTPTSQFVSRGQFAPPINPDVLKAFAEAYRNAYPIATALATRRIVPRAGKPHIRLK